MRGVWLLLLLTGWCSAQQGEYVLAGSVVNARTGEPVKRALVTAIGFATPADVGDATAARPHMPVPPVNVTALTDVSGAFRFTGLAAGTYNLTAQKPHFTEPATEREPIRLESSSKEDLRLELSPMGTIEGRVLDQRDRPMPGASIKLLGIAVVMGRRQTTADKLAATDDRGIFRFWDVAPGRYLIKADGHGGTTYNYPGEAGQSNGGFVGFVPAYFGGTTMASATPVVTEPGSEAKADISVDAQPAHKIRGTVDNFGEGFVEFALLSGDEEIDAGRVNFSHATGAFEMLSVVDGSYTLRALVENRAIAEVPLIVQGADVSGVRMVLAGPVEVPVNVRIQGQVDAKEQPQRAAQEARVVPISQAPGSCQVVLYGGENGGQQTAVQFLDGPPMSVLPGGSRVSTVCTFAYLVSASMGNADLLANPWITVAPGSAPAPIEIVARRGSGAIVGTVKLQQAPAGKITCILAVPEGSPRDPAFVCVMNGDGTRFSFESPVPGEYKLYAFSNDQVEYSNREFLGGLSGGESVQVDEGATAQVTITKVVQ